MDSPSFMYPKQFAGPEPSRAPRTMMLSTANLEAHNNMNPSELQNETYVPTEVDSNADTEPANQDEGEHNNQLAAYGIDATHQNLQSQVSSVAPVTAHPTITNQPRGFEDYSYATTSQDRHPAQSAERTLLDRIAASLLQEDSFGNDQEESTDLSGRSLPPSSQVETNPPSLLERLGGSSSQEMNSSPTVRPSSFDALGQSSHTPGFQSEHVPRASAFKFERPAISDPVQFPASSFNTPQPRSSARPSSFDALGQSSHTPEHAPRAQVFDAFERPAISDPVQYPTPFFDTPQPQSGPFSSSLHRTSLDCAMSEGISPPSAFEQTPVHYSTFQSVVQPSSALQEQSSPFFSFDNSHSRSPVSQDVSSRNPFERYANTNPFQLAAQSSSTQHQQPGNSSFNPFNSSSGVSEDTSSSSALPLDRFTQSIANLQQPTSPPNATPFSRFEEHVNVSPCQQTYQNQGTFATAFGGGGNFEGSREITNAFERYANWDPFTKPAPSTSSWSDVNANSSFVAGTVNTGIQNDIGGPQFSFGGSNETLYPQPQQDIPPSGNSYFQPSFPHFPQYEGRGGGPLIAQAVGLGLLNPLIFGSNPLLARFGFDTAVNATAPLANFESLCSTPAAFGLESNVALPSSPGLQSDPEPEIIADPFAINPMDSQNGYWSKMQGTNIRDGAVDSDSLRPSTTHPTPISVPKARTFKPLPRRGVQLSGPQLMSSRPRIARSKSSDSSSESDTFSDSSSESSSTTSSSALGKRKVTEWDGRVDVVLSSMLAQRQTVRRTEIESSYEHIKLQIESPPSSACSSPTEPMHPWPSVEYDGPAPSTAKLRSLTRVRRVRSVRRPQTRPQPALMSSVIEGLATVFARFSF